MMPSEHHRRLGAAGGIPFGQPALRATGRRCPRFQFARLAGLQRNPPRQRLLASGSPRGSLFYITILHHCVDQLGQDPIPVENYLECILHHDACSRVDRVCTCP
jgi:hypothetical protein